MDSLIFGHTLRMLRTTAGISLRTLAKKIDVSPAYLSQVELGKLPTPTHNRIKKIAETIGIPVSLLTEISHRPNPDVILLLQGHQELNELIKMAFDIGLEDRDIFEMISLMQRLGGSGFRKLMHYGLEHSSDFMLAGRSDIHVEISPYPINQMSFSKLGNPRLVFKKLEFTDKNDLFRYMIENISKIYSDSFDLDWVYQELVAREADDSSGLGNGIAIPHLFVDGLDQTIVAIARIPDGIDFSAIDKKPVYFVCLILSNPESYQSHLILLAYLARKFQIPKFMEEILEAGSKKNILSMLFGGNDSSIHLNV